MQYNTPPRRSTRSDVSTPVHRRPRKDYAPRRRKNKALSVLPLLLGMIVVVRAVRGKADFVTGIIMLVVGIICIVINIRRRR